MKAYTIPDKINPKDIVIKIDKLKDISYEGELV